MRLTNRSDKDQFREAGLDPEKPPKTWTEFREYAKKLTKHDAQGNTTRVGYAIRHVGHPHGIVHKHFWALYSAGVRLVDDPLLLRGGKALVDNDGGRAALKLVLDMLDVDKSTSLNFPDPRAAFLKGIASMQISETVSIKARQPKEAPDLKWGVALPPVPKAGDTPATLLGAWIYAVPKQARNKALAWQAIEWINSPEKDLELCKKYDASPRYQANWDKEPFRSDPCLVALKGMYPYGKKLPINLGFNGVMDAVGGAIQKVWHHEASLVWKSLGYNMIIYLAGLQAIPAAFYEAARIDGAGEVRIVLGIVAPLIRTTLATVAMILFLGSWNDFLWPVIVINSQELRTLPVGIALFKDPYGSINYGPLMAATVISLGPMLLAYVLSQRYMIRGIALTGLKG